ncbi:MAG: cryptochrome/photolyase family protein [Puniceicoccales bacterium]
MPASSPLIVWFRKDLRIRDNAALAAAMAEDRPILPVFIWEEREEGDWSPGSASRLFLQEALASLGKDLRSHGLKLILRSGRSQEVLASLLEETGAEGVYWNRRYTPFALRVDAEVKKWLREQNRVAESFNASLLFEPWTLSTQQGKPYQVFTPYWKSARRVERPEPVKVDLRKLKLPGSFPKSETLDALGLVPDHPWVDKVSQYWEVGEQAALDRLREFLRQDVEDYREARDIPSVRGTSKLSGYLHWGLIGPRQIWQELIEAGKEESAGGQCFLAEIGWREFAYHVLYHFPDTPDRPLREKYEDFPWEEKSEVLELWRKGRTGYPIVDAGMRQLWEEGWMHNRVRMIVGSFLVKHLLHSWSHGARWFWDCLVDADLASNTLGWQWSGGCGADAAPYFRVFNPMTQGEKFDPEGEYVRRYVPELANLPASVIHQPWEASDRVLREAGVRLGHDYPRPMIDHRQGRERALKAFEKVKG